MKPITLELTPQEAQWFLGFIDAGLKAPNGGVQVLQQAFVLQQKLAAAVNAAEAAANRPAKPN